MGNLFVREIGGEGRGPGDKPVQQRCLHKTEFLRIVGKKIDFIKKRIFDCLTHIDKIYVVIFTGAANSRYVFLTDKRAEVCDTGKADCEPPFPPSVGLAVSQKNSSLRDFRIHASIIHEKINILYLFRNKLYENRKILILKTVLLKY